MASQLSEALMTMELLMTISDASMPLRLRRIDDSAITAMTKDMADVGFDHSKQGEIVVGISEKHVPAFREVVASTIPTNRRIWNLREDQRANRTSFYVLGNTKKALALVFNLVDGRHRIFSLYGAFGKGQGFCDTYLVVRIVIDITPRESRLLSLTNSRQAQGVSSCFSDELKCISSEEDINDLRLTKKESKALNTLRVLLHQPAICLVELWRRTNLFGLRGLTERQNRSLWLFLEASRLDKADNRKGRKSKLQEVLRDARLHNPVQLQTQLQVTLFGGFVILCLLRDRRVVTLTNEAIFEKIAKGMNHWLTLGLESAGPEEIFKWIAVSCLLVVESLAKVQEGAYTGNEHKTIMEVFTEVLGSHVAENDMPSWENVAGLKKKSSVSPTDLEESGQEKNGPRSDQRGETPAMGTDDPRSCTMPSAQPGTDDPLRSGTIPLKIEISTQHDIPKKQITLPVELNSRPEAYIAIEPGSDDPRGTMPLTELNSMHPQACSLRLRIRRPSMREAPMSKKPPNFGNDIMTTPEDDFLYVPKKSSTTSDIETINVDDTDEDSDVQIIERPSDTDSTGGKKITPLLRIPTFRRSERNKRGPPNRTLQEDPTPTPKKRKKMSIEERTADAKALCAERCWRAADNLTERIQYWNVAEEEGFFFAHIRPISSRNRQVGLLFRYPYTCYDPTLSIEELVAKQYQVSFAVLIRDAWNEAAPSVLLDSFARANLEETKSVISLPDDWTPEMAMSQYPTATLFCRREGRKTRGKAFEGITGNTLDDAVVRVLNDCDKNITLIDMTGTDTSLMRELSMTRQPIFPRFVKCGFYNYMHGQMTHQRFLEDLRESIQSVCDCGGHEVLGARELKELNEVPTPNDFTSPTPFYKRIGSEDEFDELKPFAHFSKLLRHKGSGSELPDSALCGKEYGSRGDRLEQGGFLSLQDYQRSMGLGLEPLVFPKAALVDARTGMVDYEGRFSPFELSHWYIAGLTSEVLWFFLLDDSVGSRFNCQAPNSVSYEPGCDREDFYPLFLEGPERLFRPKTTFVVPHVNHAHSPKIRRRFQCDHCKAVELFVNYGTQYPLEGLESNPSNH